MNIKTLPPNVLPMDTRLRAEKAQAPKTQSSTDRDANGQSQREQEEPKRHLSEDEFNEALKVLKETPGIVTHNLTVRVAQEDDHRVVFIEDASGQVIRRLAEADLWLVTRDKDRPTGKILDRAM